MERFKDSRHVEYLRCESRHIYYLLMLSGGMMGAYTFLMRGGVFCNAQTANVLMMAIAFGQGRWSDGLYYLIPIFAYMLGSFLSEILPVPVQKRSFLRWETMLIGIEALILLGIGFIPLTVPDQVVQVLVNFIASMQYNTFRQAEGVPMATTFCTNHVRQVGLAAAKAVRQHSLKSLKRGGRHLAMVFSFLLGCVSVTLLSGFLGAGTVWLTLVPLGIILVKLIRADLLIAREEREKESGEM